MMRKMSKRERALRKKHRDEAHRELVEARWRDSSQAHTSWRLLSGALVALYVAIIIGLGVGTVFILRLLLGGSS